MSPIVSPLGTVRASHIYRPLVTPAGIIVSSFLRSPLTLDGQHLNVVRVTFSQRLPTIAPNWTDDRYGYLSFSRHPVPIWNQDHTVFLGGELTEGSIVRIAIEPHDPLPILKEVMVITANASSIFDDGYVVLAA